MCKILESKINPIKFVIAVLIVCFQQVNSQSNDIQLDQQLNIKTKFIQYGALYENEKNNSRMISQFNKGQKCIVLKYYGHDKYKIQYKNWVGFVTSNYLAINDKMKEIVKKFEENQKGEVDKENVEFVEQNRKKVKEKNRIAKQEQETKAKAEEEARIKQEQEDQLKREAEARSKAKQEAEDKARAVQEAKRLADLEKAKEEARIKREQEAQLQREAEANAKAKAEEEERIRLEQEAKAKQEAEDKTRADQEAKRLADLEKAKEEARIKQEQEDQLKREAEARAKAEEESRKRLEQEAKAKHDAEEKTKAEKIRQKQIELQNQIQKEKNRLADSMAKVTDSINAIRKSCSYQMNETDNFYSEKIVRTENYRVNNNLHIELYNNGKKKQVFINYSGNDLGCVSYFTNNRSFARIEMENNNVVTIYHTWNMDCFNFSIRGSLTDSAISKLENSPIKSIKLHGTKGDIEIENLEYKEFFMDKLKCID